MMTNERPYCQVAGCGSTTDVRGIEVDLVDAWEASPRFTTITMHVPLCASCAGEAERRIEAMLQARTEFHDLLAIITAAVGYEKAQALKLEATEAEVERLELANGSLRKTLQDTELAYGLARAYIRGWGLPAVGGVA